MFQQLNLRVGLVRKVAIVVITTLISIGFICTSPSSAVALPLDLTPDPWISEIDSGGVACSNVPGYGASVGATMSVDPGTWDSGVSLTYQWYTNSYAIPGATGTTYKIKTIDAQTRLGVVVTGSKSGFTSVSKRSTYNPLIGYGIYTVGTPTVSGIQSVGNTLTADPGTWESGVSLSYQWWRGPGLPGTQIPGATTSSYTLVPQDMGRSITLMVTGRLYGIQYTPDPPPCARSYAPSLSITAGTLSLSPSPSISGTWVVGETLSANPGIWDSDVTLEYQWRRSGVAIAGANLPNYSLVDADLGTTVSLVVTGSKPGYSTISRLTSGQIVGIGTFSSTPTPLISGDAIVGQMLTANLGSWDSAANLRFQWKRSSAGNGWEDIYLANSATYQVTSSDLGKQLLLFVETTNTGYNTVQKISENTSVVVSPNLQIHGSIQEGYVYSSVGQWPTGTALWYQWYRNSVAIPGETGTTYAIQAGDVNSHITLIVTGNKTSFPTIYSESNDVWLRPLNPVPTINGSPSVGSLLTGTPGIWNGGVTLSYQWLRSGSTISGATGATYVVTSSDLGHYISLRVSGVKNGFQYGSATSIQTSQVGEAAFTLTPSPTISGVYEVGQRLTADAGTWDAGAYLIYHWYRDGQQIVGTGFGTTYTLTPDDLNKNISVTVTGSKSGFANTSITSESHLVSEGIFSSITPSVIGNPWPGERLISVQGTITPLPSNISCRWLRDGSGILGANECSYSVTLDDLGHSLSFESTVVKSGYRTLHATSASVSATLGTLSSSPVPQIGGLNSVGYVLNAYTGQWDSGVNFTYQWLREGSPIVGATLSTYSLTNEDAGSSISLEVQGLRTGYNPVLRNSISTGIISGGLQLQTPTPSISGITYVGQTLTATSHTWDNGVSLSYQWRCSGTEISGATSNTYVLQSRDAGCYMSVDVAGSRPGFADVLKSSRATTVVAGGTLANTPNPIITGTEQSGNTLIASSGIWDPGVQFVYQWLRNGNVIIGASNFYFPLSSADVGARISVEITGSRAGFAPVSKVSVETQLITPFPTPPSPPPRYITQPGTNSNFVYQAYKDFLGRQPTGVEVSNWSSKLSTGEETQATLAKSLSTSDEWIQVVIRGFYVDTLGREPDNAGYQYWIGRARSGMSTADIGAFFYGSDEYFNGFGRGSQSVWIGDLYQKLMLRGADIGGLNYWLAQLQTGAMNRTQVSKWFYQSPEKRGLRVDALYTKLLNRNSDAGGRLYWAERLYSEGDLSLASMLASSPEYFGRQYSE